MGIIAKHILKSILEKKLRTLLILFSVAVPTVRYPRADKNLVQLIRAIDGVNSASGLLDGIGSMEPQSLIS